MAEPKTKGAGHLFAEHGSRYEFRCVLCGVRATDPASEKPCPKAHEAGKPY